MVERYRAEFSDRHKQLLLEEESELNDVVQVVGTEGGFVALKSDGSLYTWGTGSFKANGLRDELLLVEGNELRFGKLYATRIGTDPLEERNGGAVAAVTQDRRSIYCLWSKMDPDSFTIWGGTWAPVATGSHPRYIPPCDWVPEVPFLPIEDSRIKEVTPGAYTFAALREDGSVFYWGEAAIKGVNSYYGCNTAENIINSGVQKVVATREGFAALKEDGTVYTWGGTHTRTLYAYPYTDHVGRDSSLPTAEDTGLTDVVDIVATTDSFGVVKRDGTYTTWSDSNTDPSLVSTTAQWRDTEATSSSPFRLFGSDYADDFVVMRKKLRFRRSAV